MIKKRNLYALPWVLAAGLVGILISIAVYRMDLDFWPTVLLAGGIQAVLMGGSFELAARRYDKRHPQA